MKIRKGYSLRKILDIYLVIGIGEGAYMPNCIMSVNETGAYLWSALESGASEADLVAKLLAEYEVDEATADRDVAKFLDQLKEKDLLEAC